MDASKFRNIALVGHSGSGKTSVGEAILYCAGVTTRLGKVAEGTSHLDASAEEIKRKTTINMALSTVDWRGYKYNILDAPGYADFVGEVLYAMTAADAVVLMVNAQAGVEPETEKLFEMAQERKKPVVFLVNHMDKDQANPEKVLSEIRDRLTDRVMALQIPVGVGPNFKGVVDVITGKAYLNLKDDKITQDGDVPADIQSMLDEIRSGLTDMAAESDDALLEKFLEGNELTNEELYSGLRKGIASGTIFPLFYTSAETLIGVSTFMDAMFNYFPSPIDVPGPLAIMNDSGEEISVEAKTDGSTSTFIFKTLPQDKAQEISLFRVYSGKLAAGMEVVNPGRRSTERLGQLYELRGKDRVDVDEVTAGGMGAISKFKNSKTGDTLCSKDNQIIFNGAKLPEPVFAVALAPKSKGDEDKLGNALSRLQEIDPSMQVEVNAELHQTILRAMGDQQVDVILTRLRERFNVDVETGKVRIPYRETIRGKVEDSYYRHKKQTGGRGQFGDVHLKIEPLPSGSGFEFENKVVGGNIPSKFIPAIEKGVREVLPEGALAGYPVVDIRVTVFDGSYHDVDSSEMAFKIASSQAFKKGFMEAKPILLEPIVQVEVVAPKDYMGDIMGDLSGKRGRISGNEVQGRKVVISAQVPLSEMSNYSTQLRSMTQARAWFKLQLSHYEEVPRELVERLLDQLRAEQE
ncbi:MAG: elongation factor G [Candidatus Eisenbacteria bacterium]|uniref:Elongation factor G n=1 Tax=Eiseniibacteriota bacterium TaxID=2212470 RepID=A0A948WCX4_UNCEI|nr:elongation factor G [Candidatus Eisenbacteria bacterium]MBU1949439.1 elongation factor G [Candidatus Eisenbacteria bacterium]MBU2691313.1 elongation factor G [Candidatus Eisenbacteria bacterium]